MNNNSLILYHICATWEKQNLWECIQPQVSSMIIQLTKTVGDSDSPCADRWCTENCSLEAKHTETQYLTWFGKSPTSTGESPYYLEIREGIQYKYVEEEDHFTQTLLPALIHCCTWQQGCCPWQQLLFLSYSLYCTHHSLSHFALSLSRCPFIGNNGVTALALLQQRWLHMGYTILSMVGATTIDNGNPLFLG